MSKIEHSVGCDQGDFKAPPLIQPSWPFLYGKKRLLSINHSIPFSDSLLHPGADLDADHACYVAAAADVAVE